MLRMGRPITLVLLPLCILCSVATANLYPQFDEAFTDFLRENGYRGGAVAAMKDGRLLVARGYGHNRAGQEVSAYSKFPVSSIAKSMTAVGIVHLVKEGALSLDDKVFGPSGILSYIAPWKSDDVDTRLYDITVDQLLHHSAGWDSKQKPLYDPLFNREYQQRGHQVPNIAKELGKAFPLQPIGPEELISYVISFPLAFTPGTQMAYSNIGYLALGRVIEAVSGMEYKDYIKRLILDRCGMWNTRLELAHYVEEEVPGATSHDPLTLYNLDPISIDSTLGWYSNVYDLMRFSRCLFDRKILLDDEHLAMLLAKLPSTPSQLSETWQAAGFRVSDKRAVWQDADLHTDDLLLYHGKPFGAEPHSVDVVLDQVNNDGGKNATHHHHGQPEKELPDSWAIVLCDKNVNHLRHQSKEIMSVLRPSVRVSGGGRAGADENIFLFDLSEMHRHRSWQPPKTLAMPEFTLRFKVDEHHLTAYVNALRAEGFTLQSFTSHTHKQNTFFLLVGKKEATPAKPDADFFFEHGMDHRQLMRTKLRLEESRYNMTLLHSYKSKSHAHQYAYAALFNYETFNNDVQMKYGTSHLPEPYEKLVQMYHEQEFFPLSQTVIYHSKDERFSFIFVRRTGGTKVDFRQFYNLSEKRLTKVTAESARKNLHLSYLSSYSVAGKYRMSAIFTNETHYKGVLEVDQPIGRATEITIINLQDGLYPKQIVPYFNDKKQLRIAAYYEEV